MRLRVLGVLSILSILMVLGVSYALLSASSRELTQYLQINRVSALNRFAQLAADAQAGNDVTTLQTEMDTYSKLYGEGVLVRLGDQTLSSGNLDPERDDVRNALFNAALNLSITGIPPLQPFVTGSELISRSFGSANQVLGEVVLEVDADTAREKLRTRWLQVGVSAMVLESALLFLAARLTRWVLRPVHRLNSAVMELAATGTPRPLPEDGPPELRDLSRSFTAMAGSVKRSIDQQRQLIADTSHQLRNPVAALRLRIDLLQLQLQATRDQEALTAVEVELERLERILDGVLRLATAEHRAFEGQARRAVGPESPGIQAKTDPYAVVREELERVAPAARLSGTLFTFEASPESYLQLDCSAFELAQMVGELFSNAAKYAPGAQVRVVILVRPASVEIEIADDGPGLSAEELAASTSRFWRSPRHSNISGSGLGMTIVDRLARANGGRLELYRRQPHGLRARLVFPHMVGESSHD
ncbi:MAG TPA: HAMP domain-containing sensor histidine kinase [Arthrobacter sp.]|nr:HAMP domain-containing sensor histidine kinase [Arthrobacter sp.]